MPDASPSRPGLGSKFVGELHAEDFQHRTQAAAGAPGHEAKASTEGEAAAPINFAGGRQTGYASRRMFREELAGVVDRTEGGIAGIIMDFEGIPLETYARDSVGPEIETMGAEISVIVKAIQRAAEMLEIGATEEVAFRSERVVTLIRIINESYFVAVALTPSGNLGKGRYLLRLAVPKFRQGLA